MSVSAGFSFINATIKHLFIQNNHLAPSRDSKSWPPSPLASFSSVFSSPSASVAPEPDSSSSPPPSPIRFFLRKNSCWQQIGGEFVHNYKQRLSSQFFTPPSFSPLSLLLSFSFLFFFPPPVDSATEMSTLSGALQMFPHVFEEQDTYKRYYNKNFITW